MDKTLDLDELERVAREATPGPWDAPWHAARGPSWGIKTADPYNLRHIASVPTEQEADALYIATFDPPTILTLIAAARPAETRDWSEFEDDIADAISDSMDMDWSSRDGARAVVAYLKQIGAKLP